MRLVTVTPASILPVTLTEAKAQCRYTASDKDTEITQMIWDAAASIENVSGVRLSPCTVRLELDGFPCGMEPIDLGVHPVRSITSVKYDDENNVEQTLNLGSPIDYWEDLAGLYPRIVPTDYWPDTYIGKPATVRILMTVGFTSSVSSPNTHPIPRDLCRAVLMKTEMYFDDKVDHSLSIASHIGPWRRRFV